MQIESTISSLNLSEIETKIRSENQINGNLVEDALYLYKVFLQLKKTYPQKDIIPTEIIDVVWHNHILFTKKYAKDCQSIFGKFIHHTPSLTQGQKSRVKEGKKTTLILIKKHFPELLDV